MSRIMARPGSFLDEHNTWLARVERDEQELEDILRRAHRDSVVERVGAPRAVIVPRIAPPHRFPAPLAPVPGMAPRDRGVYVADYLTPQGRYILLAINRRGHCVARSVVREIAFWDVYVEQLWGELETLDPAPVRLLR